MRREKIAYIIPGYCQSHTKQRGYNKITKFFEVRGIKPVHVNIKWAQRKPERFSDYLDQFLRAFKNPKNAEVYVLGFSYGAMIALLTASKTKPKALILCSLSPYFEEDLVKMKPSWLKWWRKNFANSDYSFSKLAPKIRTETYLIVGDKEHPSCLARARAAKRKIVNSHLHIAKGAKHNISQKKYLKMIRRLVINLK